MTAVLVCYATRFVDMFVRSQLETLGSSFAMNMFSLNEKDAVRYVSMAQGTVGFLTLFVYIGYICLDLERWSVTFWTRTTYFKHKPAKWIHYCLANDVLISFNYLPLEILARQNTQKWIWRVLKYLLYLFRSLKCFKFNWLRYEYLLLVQRPTRRWNIFVALNIVWIAQIAHSWEDSCHLTTSLDLHSALFKFIERSRDEDLNLDLN